MDNVPVTPDVRSTAPPSPPSQEFPLNVFPVRVAVNLEPVPLVSRYSAATAPPVFEEILFLYWIPVDVNFCVTEPDCEVSKTAPPYVAAVLYSNTPGLS